MSQAILAFAKSPMGITLLATTVSCWMHLAVLWLLGFPFLITWGFLGVVWSVLTPIMLLAKAEGTQS